MTNYQLAIIALVFGCMAAPALAQNNRFEPGYYQRENRFEPGYVQDQNRFEPGYIQRDNRFEPGYVQDQNRFEPGYIQDDNRFEPGYVQDKGRVWIAGQRLGSAGGISPPYFSLVSAWMLAGLC